MPLVTIIIPVYNTDKYLKQCLDSVVNQTYKNIEIIVINDASTDFSYTILKSYAKQYQNVNLINNYANLGVSASRNKGLNASNGDYIYFLDSDDYIELDAIEKMINLAIIYEVPLVKANYTEGHFSFWKQENPKKETNNVSYINIEKRKDTLKKEPSIVWNKLYSHELIGDFRFSEKLFFGEDNAFTYPLLTKANRYVQTDDSLYVYRKNLKSVTKRNRFIPNTDILNIYDSLDVLQEKCLELGTYETYKEQMDAIIETKAYFPLFQIATWLHIREHDKRQILNNLYQYGKKEYHLPKIKDIDIECVELSQMRLLRLKQQILLHYINENAQNVMFENSCNHTRRILSKYKR